MKKLLSIVLCLLMVAALQPLHIKTTAADTYFGSCGDNLTWSFDSETGHLTISGTGDMRFTYYEGYCLPEWDDYRYSIKTVEIQEGVLNIADSAFSGCSQLRSVTMGDSVTSIGSRAFYNCQTLSEVRGGNITNIGKRAFYDCKALDSIILAEGLTEIADYAFSGCAGLTSITIPNSVTSIGGGAFSGCTGLTSITIPDGVTSIGNSAFSGCTGLTSIAIPDSVTSIGNSAFSGCTGLQSVTIPDSVTVIGRYAFSGCTGLQSVTIPNSVTSIGEGAFSGCTALAEIRFGFGIDTIGKDAFLNTAWMNAQADGPVYVQDILITYKGECPDVYTVEDGTRIIGDGAFYGQQGLKSIIIPTGVIAIGESAFENCKALTSVEIPDSVLTIDMFAFYDCFSLTAVELPPHLDKIMNMAFAYSGLVSIDIPDGVTEIRVGAFEGCGALTSVNIPDSVQIIEESAFFMCSELEEITIPDSVTVIERYAFAWSGKLATVNMSKNIVDFQDRVFEDTAWWDAQPDGLVYIEDILVGYKGEEPTDLVIDDGTRVIGGWAFIDCENLKTVDIPDSVQYICGEAFRGCTGIREVVIPDSVLVIRYQAFDDCEKLSSVTLGSGLVEIGWGAFFSCPSLTDVWYNGTEAQYEERLKDGIVLDDEYEWALFNATWHFKDAYSGQCGDTLYWSFDRDSGTLTITGSGDMWDYSFQSPAPWMAVNDLGDPMIGYVLLPDELTHIGKCAFADLVCLSGITIPEKVTGIGENAFCWCEGLRGNITIPDSVTTIGVDAFNGCKNLQSVTLSNNLTYIPQGLFSECSSLTEITIPDSVTSIGYAAFHDCAALKEITIPDGVKNINENAFGYCNSLETVTIGKGVTQIPDWAFRNCSALKQITISKNVTYVWSTAFTNCTGLTDVYYEGTKAECEAQLTVLSKELKNAAWHYLTPAFTPAVEWNAEDVKFKGSTPYVTANGSAQTPRFTVKNSADGSVVDPENYDYEYVENTAPGTGYVIVTFKGDYEGTCRGFFKIYLPPTATTTVENVGNGIKLTWSPVEGAAGYVIYRRAWSSTTNGWTTFERWNNTTGTTYIDGADANHKVYAGSRYQYGVKAYFARRTDPVSGATIGGNVGDNYNLGEVGPLKTTVRITTRTLNSVTAGTRQMTVKWGASSVFTGYQIKYATDKNFTKNVVAIKITDPKTAQTVIKNLKKGTTYYVTIRSYHEFNGMTYFGEWSNVLSCKVK